ncbi:MAG: rRNA cytosine-C5-methyltransferase [Bacteroidales bacterium]|nr:rRNA cytosine-C5-methyltransferase [Bacteroidales bacterium]
METSNWHIFKESIASVTEADALLAALGTERLTSIRVNPKKCNSLSFPNVPWCDTGYYLEKRPIFTLDPLFHAGAYYVQEASSMFLEQIIKPFATRPIRVLDLCAAPGGKTTLALSLLPEGSLMIANEVIKNRSQILSENLIKWGYSNCIVTNNDPKDFSFLKGAFDIIIVDAPCSGEGMFRKDSDAISEWSPENVDLCSKRQLRILYDIWDCLAPDGLLIYSTCTFNEKENEDVVARFVSENNAHCERVPLQSEWNVTEREKNGAFSYRFFPHKTKGEGFSVSVIRKNDGQEYVLPKRVQQAKSISFLSEKNTVSFKNFVSGFEPIHFNDRKNLSWAFPMQYKDFLSEIASHCNLVHAGVPIVECIGNKINPLAGLAFSTNYNKNAFPSVAVDLEQAVRYFKKETLFLPDAEKGWNNITFNNTSIGFVKNIGNRANNPYPQEWAIKMNVDYTNLKNVI